MKKLKLNLQYLKNAEVLTRSQLKNVLGGDPPVTDQRMFTYGKCEAPVVGSWEYNPGVNINVCTNDIYTYCSNQAGICTNYPV